MFLPRGTFTPKEMSIPGQEEEFERELGRALLTKKDQEIFLQQLHDPTSYDHSRAQLYHYNLKFACFHEGTITAFIEISAMTGNIDIYSTSTDAVFRDNCSTKFGKLLLHLIDRYQFNSHFDEIDLEGITATKE